jgi:hypothetical protein
MNEMGRNRVKRERQTDRGDRRESRNLYGVSGVDDVLMQ